MSTKSLIAGKWKSIFWLLLLVFLGIAAFIAAPMLKKAPKKITIAERAVKVRALTVSEIDVVPRVIGYGKVEPARTWEAVAEVPGQVKWVSDALRDGRIVTAGTELLRIEDSNYKLNLVQAEAQLRASKVKNKTFRDALAIAQKELKLFQADYERKKILASKRTIAKTDLDAAERAMLTSQTQVANLQNSIDLNTAEHQVLVAQRDAARLDLKRTRLVAPFDARITDVKIGVAQYANKGQLMFSADGLDVAEIPAQFAAGILRPLIFSSAEGDKPVVGKGPVNLQAIVRRRTATHTAVWPARISRVTGSVDQQTQSIGIVVAIDRPNELVEPGKRPQLFRNTFVEIELFLLPIKNQIVIPLSAIHEGIVHVLDDDMRLRSRKVKILFSQKSYAVLQEGLRPGDRIVTSDLITAIDGMLLAPEEDRKTKRQLILDATGKEPTK